MSKVAWFDMDGVLADLSKGLSQADGYEDPILWFIHQDNDKLTFPKAIERNINNGFEIFAELPPMPSFLKMKVLMRSLISKGYTINILSSSMDQSYSDKIDTQKRKWCKKHLSDITLGEIVIVKGSKLKIGHIKEGDILIDDYNKTQQAFIDKGIEDQFFLYIGFDKLISDLLKRKIITY